MREKDVDIVTFDLIGLLLTNHIIIIIKVQWLTGLYEKMMQKIWNF